MFINDVISDYAKHHNECIKYGINIINTKIPFYSKYIDDTFMFVIKFDYKPDKKNNYFSLYRYDKFIYDDFTEQNTESHYTDKYNTSIDCKFIKNQIKLFYKKNNINMNVDVEVAPHKCKFYAKMQ